MATDWTQKNVLMVKNEKFIQKAQALIPQLYMRTEEPRYWGEGEDLEGSKWSGETSVCGKGDRIIFDFGHNHAGYFHFSCKSVGSPQDAPAFLKIKFCEVEKEINEECDEYSGWISKGWLQEEWLHLDELPCDVKMERRYAFRFVVITVIDTSQKFQVLFRNVRRETVSSISMKDYSPLDTEDEEIKKIDEISVRTLANCMQTVFEDGPKRDRRLWLGDLRLQALTAYQVFHEYDLAKRCLYLFAGMTDQTGMIPACVFEKPEPHMDDTFLLDYSLFFIPALLEYYEQSQDRETLEELAPQALKQMEIALTFVDRENIVGREGEKINGREYHCFTDWNDILDKHCTMQAVIIYCLGYSARLCALIRDARESYYIEKQKKMADAARKVFWDKEMQAFVSGPTRQVSSASQVWMVLAGVLQGKDAAGLLARTEKNGVRMVTPYMHHFYVSALIQCGEKEKAIRHIKDYWGGMIKDGADTFWELYDPQNKKESPYGSDSVNSYCHAWSCTPAYLFRKYYI